MIKPVDSSTQFSFSVSPPTRNFGQDLVSADTSGDSVTFSQEALGKIKGEPIRASLFVDEELPAPTWYSATGLKAGTFAMENGHSQVISIKDGALEILEYDQDKLVKSVKGTLSADGATFETELFDSSGEVTQSVHIIVKQLSGQADRGNALVERDIKWFEGGILSGEMRDSMTLDSSVQFRDPGEVSAADGMAGAIKTAMESAAADVEAAKRKITTEEHYTDYYAVLRQYDQQGTLRQNVTVESGGKFGHKTNHSDLGVEKMLSKSTSEIYHKTNDTIRVEDYDWDGSLIREATLNNKQVDSPLSDEGKQEQSLGVTWYNRGEIVKRSNGTMELSESAGHGLSKWPGFSEMFNLTNKQYIDDGPQRALGIVGQNFGKMGSDPEFFSKAFVKHAQKGDYALAKDIGETGNIDQPYSVSWTDELYKDGELSMRQTDTEGARELSFYKQQQGVFRVGYGLTEDERPSVLRESSHELETFKGGESTSRRSVNSREELLETARQPDRLVTGTHVEQSGAAGELKAFTKGFGELDKYDSDMHGAAEDFGNNVESLVDDLVRTFGELNKEEDPQSKEQDLALNVQAIPFPKPRIV